MYEHFGASYEDLLSKGRKLYNESKLGDWGLYVSKNTLEFQSKFHEWYFQIKINGREVRDKYKWNLDIPKWNQKAFGYKSLKLLGPKIWNN